MAEGRELQLTQRESSDLNGFLLQTMDFSDEQREGFVDAFLEDVARHRKNKEVVDGWLDEMDNLTTIELKDMRVKLYKMISNKEKGQVLINGQLRCW